MSPLSNRGGPVMISASMRALRATHSPSSATQPWTRVPRLTCAPASPKRCYSSEPPKAFLRNLTLEDARKMIVWPFWAVNGLVFFWWQQAKVDANQRQKARPGDAGSVTMPRYIPESERYRRINEMQEGYTVSLKNVREGRWRTVLTSAISHEGLGHMIFNMISFNAFVSAASLYNWRRKGQFEAAGLGASGVVTGLSAAAALTVPFAPFQIFFIPIAIPLWVLSLGYVAYDTYRLNSVNSKVGHAAHLGGAAFGVLFYMLRLRKLGGVPDVFRYYKNVYFPGKRPNLPPSRPAPPPLQRPAAPKEKTAKGNKKHR
ncbi:Uu.00g092330.m01.CDS01 [Anthostomella pinea]|uniref:Uu.00g092330.m01.CDS01 n=1 Tax=Anthostomella pinea TaxID=933095 RepID=A0AAI8VNX2_9PEZI|nr:Uu.00g092330.m01.CDS01 [Anthostomella pinea]